MYGEEDAPFEEAVDRYKALDRQLREALRREEKGGKPARRFPNRRRLQKVSKRMQAKVAQEEKKARKVASPAPSPAGGQQEERMEEEEEDRPDEARPSAAAADDSVDMPTPAARPRTDFSTLFAEI
jgi:hypothetical protein